METFTRLPFGPRSFFCTPSCVIPMAELSLIRTILSPDWMPSASLGPPAMGATTRSVSARTWYSMPIPSKLPWKSSVTLCISAAGMYTEWGSS